jgi:cell division protein FtsL
MLHVNFVPRVELHLFYSAVLCAPTVVAMVLHTRPNTWERVPAFAAPAPYVPRLPRDRN